MPLLAALFSNLFVGFTGFLTAYIGARAALAVTAITVIAALTVALAATLEAMVVALLLTFPTLDPAVLSLLWMAFPSNATLCISSCLAADGFVAVYRWGNANVQMAFKL